MGFVVLSGGQDHKINCRYGSLDDLACVISGTSTPFVTFDLKPSQSILCDFDDVRLLGNDITVRPWPSLSKSTRLLVNKSQGDGQTVVLSNGRSGCVGAFDLSQYGRRIICRSNSFLAAGSGVMANSYTRHKTPAYGVLEFLVMDGTGWIFLQSDGEVLERQVAAGEVLNVNASAIVAMSATVDLSSYPSLGRRQADREVDGRLAQLTGPGKVWLQSCIAKGDLVDKRAANQQTPQLALIS